MTDEVKNENTTEAPEPYKFQVFEKTKPTRQFLEDDSEYLTVTYYNLLELVEGVSELIGAGFKLSLQKSEYYPMVINGTQFFLTFEKCIKEPAKEPAVKLAKINVPSLLGDVIKEEAKEEVKEVSTVVENQTGEENTETAATVTETKPESTAGEPKATPKTKGRPGRKPAAK